MELNGVALNIFIYAFLLNRGLVLLRNMNGEGRRQLPTWMLRRCTVEETSNTEVKQQNDSEEVAVAKTSQMQKKVQRRKHSSEVASVENKSQLLEQSEARTRDANSSHQEEDQLDQEPYVLKKCRTSKSKRNNKRGSDQPDELHKSNPETNDDSTRKRYRGNTSGEKKTNKKKKKKKTNISVENSYDRVVPSEDELTVEDLVSIAEEYIRADMMESENLQLNSKARSANDLTAQKKDTKPPIHNQLPFESISTGEEIIDPLDTGNPAEDMLNLLLGGFLRRSKESERKNDAKTITRNIIIDHDIIRKSENDDTDTVGEVVPAMKKKVSLKDKVAMLLN